MTVLPGTGAAVAQKEPQEGQLRLAEVGFGDGGGLEARLDLSRLSGGLTGLQFDLLTTHGDLDVEARLSTEAQEVGKKIYLRQLQPGLFRVIITGFNQNHIQAGPLTVLSFKGTGLTLSEGRLFSIRHVVGADAGGRRVELAVDQDLLTSSGHQGGRERNGRKPLP